MLGIKVLTFPPSAPFCPLKPYTRCTLKPLCNYSNPIEFQTLTMKTLDESDVGILCYISQLPGFRGVLKQRYSDFIVNEVDFDGNVVHLTSFDLPPEIEEEGKAQVFDSTANKSYADEIESFRSIAGDADAESLKGFLDRIASSTESDISPIVLSPDPDKSHRTAMHTFFKAKFKFLVTDTLDGSDATLKCIRVRFCSGGKSDSGRGSRKRKDRGDRVDSTHKPFDSRGSNDWPDGVGKFLRFNLCKENKDTQEALGLIGKMLGTQQRSFGFAGTKDKRSVSTQRVTVFKQRAKRLAALNDRLFGIKVGDFCYVQEGLVLGQLLGNRFTITLRGVVADSEDIIKGAADNLGRDGFINYFGLQRFGSGSVPTHLVGAALLRGEWKSAVGLILDPREGERLAIMEAREYFKESGDIDGTLRQLPRHLVAERAILQCLKKCPGNYLQALKAIPRTLRMMYVHSYQSYLWNHAASRRVQKYGKDQVVLGDLVYSKGSSHEKSVEVINAEPEEDSSSDGIDYSSITELSETELFEEKVKSVKAVNAEDLLKGEYTIDDVILPLPGSRVLYPTNDIAEVYHDLAKKDGIALTESMHNAKEFSMICMTGSYRRVFQRPIDFEWEVLRYRDPNIPLAETDMDAIAKSKLVNVIEETFANGKTDKPLAVHNVAQTENLRNDQEDLPDIHEAEDERSVSKSVNVIEEAFADGNMNNSLAVDNVAQRENLINEQEGLPDTYEAEDEREERLPQIKSFSTSDVQSSQIALKLSFTLPASCYATMAIRELLKTSTSVAFHKTLNQ
ncbi:hypothetical protein AAC387_Pa06g1223 [Persea americana]